MTEPDFLDEIAQERGHETAEEFIAANEPEDAPDIAGEDIAPTVEGEAEVCPEPGGCGSCFDPAVCRNQRIAAGLTTEEQEDAAEADKAPPWVREGREPTAEEKIDVLAGTVEYLDQEIATIKNACAQMAQVLVRLVRAVDTAADGQGAASGIVGPDGEPLNRKQRRNIQFGRGA